MESLEVLIIVSLAMSCSTSARIAWIWQRGDQLALRQHAQGRGTRPMAPTTHFDGCPAAANAPSSTLPTSTMLVDDGVDDGGRGGMRTGAQSTRHPEVQTPRECSNRGNSVPHMASVASPRLGVPPGAASQRDGLPSQSRSDGFL